MVDCMVTIQRNNSSDSAYAVQRRKKFNMALENMTPSRRGNFGHVTRAPRKPQGRNIQVHFPVCYNHSVVMSKII